MTTAIMTYNIPAGVLTARTSLSLELEKRCNIYTASTAHTIDIIGCGN